MMPAMNEAIVALSGSLAASIIAKATIILLLALAGVWLARPQSASVRHAILVGGFAVLLALPIACTVSPPIRVALPIREQRWAIRADFAQVSKASPRMFAVTGRAGSVASSQEKVSWVELLWATWSIGGVLFLLPVLIGLWQVRSLRRAGLPWPRGKSLAASLKREAGIRRSVEVLVHELMNGPMTCGVLRPAVFLPLDAKNWSDEDLRRAIRHELEHVRRADWLTHCGARILCSVYWFHPLVWISQRRLILEAEYACDDAVLAGCEATAYAAQLVSLARRLLRPAKSPLLAMASRSALAARVRAVLDGSQRRDRIRAVVAVPLAIAALLITIMSPVEVIAAPPSTSEIAHAQDAPSVVKFEVVSIKPSEDNFLRLIHDGKDPIRIDDAQATLIGIDLSTIIQMAYRLPKYQVVIPRSFLRAHFDIVGKLPAGFTAAQVPEMLQSMLADRFNMAFHLEKRVQPIYFLALGPGALKLKPTVTTDARNQGCSMTGITYQCKGVTMTQAANELTKGYYFASAAQQQNLPAAVRLAEQWPDRPVIDKTGLKGAFDFTFDFGNPNSDGHPSAPPADESETVSAFSALKSLGLLLKPDEQLVQVLVVDYMAEPSPN